MDQPSANPIVIVGGGIAALEAAVALRELSDGSARIKLVAPEPDFTYRPLLVREPFSPEPADRRSLAGIAPALGAELVSAAIESLDPARRVLRLDDGSELPYGSALIAVGARMRPALTAAHTLWVGQTPTTIASILDGAQDGGRLNMIVPPGVTWTLPLYEFALLTARWLSEQGDRRLRLTVISPEDQPLIIFGPIAATEVAERLERRGIEFVGDTWVSEGEGGALKTAGGQPDLSGRCVALPVLEGRHIAGLPADEHGFIPIDEWARVQGLDDVYAAGDGTSFPLKQGGIAAQQADAAAEQIAARLGVEIEPKPFQPVLRGTLLTGSDSVHMRTDVRGGTGEGEVSSDYLWWPPHKVSSRYLARWLAGESLTEELTPPGRSIEVEVAVPHEWHSEPLGLGAYRHSGLD
jgi:sulfide:quinone oxidoreductase